MVRNLGCLLLLTAGIARAEAVTIAVLGDSITQGYGLSAEQGLVPQLESWLIAQGAEVTLINAGVSGDTTAGGLARVDWTLTPEVQGLVVALGGNDFLRGIDPALSRENLKGILAAAQQADVPVLLIGLQVSSNYGPEYKAAFEAMYPELAAEFGALHFANIFAGLEADSDLTAARAALMQGDGIHPNERGVLRIVEALGPAVQELTDRARQ